MKIGIITILKVNNYGAELQAYATQAILRQLGYDAEIIDYLFYKNPEAIRSKKSAPLFKFPIKKRIAEYLYPLIAKLRSIGNKKAIQIRKSRFEEFHKLNTASSSIYRSIEDLYRADLDYDVYVTGSDQVWNPGTYSSLAPYFLDFAPKGKKRIAYAASFGVSSIPEYARTIYSDFLKQYSAIGVREQTAVDIVRDIAEMPAQCVLDPTLLLSSAEWLKVTNPIENLPAKYILLYELTPCPYILSFAKYISATKGWDILRICKGASKEDKDSSIKNIIDAGPAEFVYIMANASFVITNSFHGTAFAINFKRQFYTVIPKRKQNNSRQTSLLNLFCLSSRMLSEDSEFPKITNVDFSDTESILFKERTKSLKFLRDAIEL